MTKNPAIIGPEKFTRRLQVLRVSKDRTEGFFTVEPAPSLGERYPL